MDSDSAHGAQIRLIAEPLTRQQIIDKLRIRLLESFDRDPDPGTLPGERQIAESLGNISRVPVREALTVLRALGIIRVDTERRQYVASTATLTPGGFLAAPSGEPLLQRELVAQFRNVVDFYREAAAQPYRPGYQLSEAVANLRQSHETKPSSYAAALIATNDVLAGLAAALGLGRAADSIQSQLDVLEFSVAAERRSRRDSGEKCDVLDPDTVHIRRQSVKFILQYIASGLEDIGRLDSAHKGLAAYLNHVVHQAAPAEELALAC